MPLRHGGEEGTGSVKAQTPGHPRLRQHDVDLSVSDGLLQIGERQVAEGRAVEIVFVEPRVRLRDEGQTRIGLGHFHGGKAQGSRGGGQSRQKRRADEEKTAKDAARGRSRHGKSNLLNAPRVDANDRTAKFPSFPMLVFAKSPPRTRSPALSECAGKFRATAPSSERTHGSHSLGIGRRSLLLLLFSSLRRRPFRRFSHREPERWFLPHENLFLFSFTRFRR